MERGLTTKDACEVVNITSKTRSNWRKQYGEDWISWLAEKVLSTLLWTSEIHCFSADIKKA